jgi:1,4-dihydroxy-2-naphthoyl-CoA synthase
MDSYSPHVVRTALSARATAWREECGMQTQYETLLVKVDGPIVEVLLNRPAKRNAINFQMVKDLNSVLRSASSSPRSVPR